MLLVHGQSYGRGDILAGEVGDEVMMADTVVAANHLQAQVLSHQFRFCRLFHRLDVVALDNLGALCLEGRDVLNHVAWHDVVAWDDDALVSGSGSRFNHTVLKGTRAEILVADVVAVESCLVDVENHLDKLRCLLRHAMDIELHQPVLGILAPHISYRQINQEIIVWLSPLQIGLAVGDVLHQFRSVAPDAVGRTHIHRSIELPAWPWIVLRRIGGAMEEHVVYAGAEHQVHIRFHLAQGCAEVLGEPGEGFAGCIFLSGDVRSRWSIFQHTEVAEVRTGLARILAQSLDAEVGQSEAFNFRNVNGCIAVDEVGW